MLGVLLIILIILWLLGYVSIPGLVVPNVVLFSINNHPITLWMILILIIVSWLIGILPSPLREIAVVWLIIWVLSSLGIITVAGLSSLLVIALIIGLVIYLLRAAI